MASPSRPRPIPYGSPHASSYTRNQSPSGDLHARSASNARLASPVPTVGRSPRGSISQSNAPTGGLTPLAGLDGSLESKQSSQPKASALTSALSASLSESPNKSSGIPAPQAPQQEEQRPLIRPGLSSDRQSAIAPDPTSFGLGSFRSHRASSAHSPAGTPSGREDFSVVRRHLVQSSETPRNEDSRRTSAQGHSTPGPAGRAMEPDVPDLSDGFSSLQMKGGDVHRAIYRRTEVEEASRRGRLQRSYSVEYPRGHSSQREMNAEQIKQPGGFRREHILRTQPSTVLSTQTDGQPGIDSPASHRNFLTSNFFEFLTIYGHFAGEEYEGDEDTETESTAVVDEYEDENPPNDERRPLLKRQTTAKRKRKESHKSGSGGTIMILLKSFVGTGVLFLPRAFRNGGMAFSVGILLGTATLSYYCFLLLTTSRLKLKASYAEMGEIAYSRWLRNLINTSLVISQIGFASAYIVFTSENLKAFVLAVSKGKTDIDIKLMILMQLVVFLPLSLYRNLNSLSYIVYIADLFIVLGLLYLYYYDIATIAEYGLGPDIAIFNKHDWTLFIGTAIFTFEGIGLIIPIQDGMRRPEKLPSILLIVMLIISTIFISMGALAYAAFGSETHTVILKNMHQDNKFVNAVQFMYSAAILLSTPMQIFPAITIVENGLFTRSGKYSKNVKWGKNTFRFAMVMLCALIAWVGANDLDKFVALVGSFACIPLVYIYPPLIHRRAVTGSTLIGLLDVAICIFGFVLMSYTSVLTIVSWISGSKGHKHGV